MNHVAHTHEESTPASSKRPSVPPASLHRTLTDIAGEIEVAAVAVEHTTPELRWRIAETLARIADDLASVADDVEAGAVEGREGDAADEPIAFRPVEPPPAPKPIRLIRDASDSQGPNESNAVFYARQAMERLDAFVGRIMTTLDDDDNPPTEEDVEPLRRRAADIRRSIEATIAEVRRFEQLATGEVSPPENLEGLRERLRTEESR